jgi:hypothetical protein
LKIFLSAGGSHASLKDDPNMKISPDWWRHLGMAALSCVGIALLKFLGGYDWSALGPWASMAPIVVQLATEAFNQALAAVPPGYAPTPASPGIVTPKIGV